MKSPKNKQNPTNSQNLQERDNLTPEEMEDSGVLCILMSDLEEEVSKEISRDKFEYFFEFEDPKMKEKLDKAIPVPLQLMIFVLQESMLHAYLSPRGFKVDMKLHRLTDKEIEILWNLIERHLLSHD